MTCGACFTAIMGVAIIFVHTSVPETKGKTTEEILGSSAMSPLLAGELYQVIIHIDEGD
jgi:hypothetical protein